MLPTLNEPYCTLPLEGLTQLSYLSSQKNLWIGCSKDSSHLHFSEHILEELKKRPNPLPIEMKYSGFGLFQYAQLPVSFIRSSFRQLKRYKQKIRVPQSIIRSF